jgi:hypothetical protein
LNRSTGTAMISLASDWKKAGEGVGVRDGVGLRVGDADSEALGEGDGDVEGLDEGDGDGEGHSPSIVVRNT